MSRNPRVALDVETSRIYGRNILTGIGKYVRSHHPWSIYLEQLELGTTPDELLKRWSGDGLITRQTTKEFAERVRQSGLPVVDLSDMESDFGLPRIGSDNDRIGAVAAEHLLDRGFRQFGCCGFSDQRWSALRKGGFLTALENSGCQASLYESKWDTRSVWAKEVEGLRQWLLSLPKPAGIFTTNDVRGQHVLNVCATEEIAVPEQVAVVGVDNDELLCDLSNPPLTSVIPNSERIGYEAARLLEQIMAGQASKGTCIEIPPIGIATRQSSDTLAIPDSNVTAALTYIREHACQGTTVQAVVDHLDVSRSGLERKFRKYLNRSPQAEIRRTQIKRVKELLSTSDLRLERIAALTGYEHPEYLSVVFKRETGESPGRFRKRTQ